MDRKSGSIRLGNYAFCWLTASAIIIAISSPALAIEARRTSSDKGTDSAEETDLQLVTDLKNARLQSSDDLLFRCKVTKAKDKNVTFTWYHDNNVIDASLDDRVKIQKRDWGSRLQILNVYTADEGLYRCEASDGEKSVHTEATLTVSFNTPPDPKTDGTIHDRIFDGKCELYQGQACKEFLAGESIYVESFQEQTKTEESISGVLKIIDNENLVPRKCAKYALPAFCNFVFPLCDPDAKRNGKASAMRLCREDCELLQYKVCADGVTTPNTVIRSLLKNGSNCNGLPETTATTSKCSRVGLKSAVNRTQHCYSDTGVSYKGVAAIAESGEACKSWPKNMLPKFPDLLAGGHNFCRNPGNVMDKPWCFVDDNRINKVECDIPKCKPPGGGSSDILIILIPCISVILLIGCIVVAVCVACRRKKATTHTPGKKVEMRPVNYNKIVVPELPAALVRFSVELGEGKFGKVFKAQIMSNVHYSSTEPVAVKTVIAGAVQAQINEFQREMDMYADLQHINVSCLKACVMQPTLRCMIFEYTSRVDLHEFLTLHSPHSDIGGGKISGSVSSHTSSNLEEGDFLHMAVQVASGLEYLATQSFIHRDLAARNILVCSNNIMKISNLGVVRDCYLSSYYRSPQGGHMLPVRWMAPESLTANMYSEKSVIWSFGVMIWEMFSYGQQPYCGYSNHEVIDMISKGQTLTCPDQCSSRVYALLRECWSSDSIHRPTSKELHTKLSGWEGASSTRMTSQLAQGIHRQLDVMREGTQFQYTPPQGTVIDGFGQPLLAAQRQPDITGVVAQSYYSSPSPSSAGAISHQPPSYPTYMQQPQSYPPVQMYPQQQMHYPRPHPAAYVNKSNHTQSSRSTDSGGSSVRNRNYGGYRGQARTSNAAQIYPASIPQQQKQQHFQPPQEYENVHGTPDSGVHSSKGIAQTQRSHENEYYPGMPPSSSPVPPPVMQRSRPGSELVTSGLEPVMKPLGNSKPVVAPKPTPFDPNRPRGNIMMGVNGQMTNRNNENDAEFGQQGTMGGPPTPNFGGKATSCDSGHPTEEGETDSGESQPFLSKATQDFTAEKGTPPISGSSSTMSSSTVATAESRLTG